MRWILHLFCLICSVLSAHTFSHSDDITTKCKNKSFDGPWPLPCELKPHVGFPPLSAYGEARPLVVGSFLGWMDGLGFDLKNISECEIQCVFLRIPAQSPQICYDQSNLLLIPNGVAPPKDFKERRPSWQRWAYFSMESGSLFTEMDDYAYMAQFDLEISTRKTASLTITYAPADPDDIRSYRFDESKRERMVLYLNSNCQAKREEFVAALMQHGIEVDALGACSKNGNLPKNVSTLELLARYKFVVAFENSQYEDYITERVYNAWTAGTIPIYWGAPNIASHAPDPDAFISPADFLDVAELALYLSHLAADPAARRHHLRFKDPSRPLSPGFLWACAHSAFAPSPLASPAPGSTPSFTSTTTMSAAMLAAASGAQTTAPAEEGGGAAVITDRKDPRCEDVHGPGGDGRAVTDPASQCHAAFAAFVRDVNRGVQLAACRICRAAAAALGEP